MQTVTLNLPEGLYRQWKRKADDAQRPIEAELLELVATASPASDALATDIEEALTALRLLDDDTLWRVARSHLAADVSAQLETLHWKQQREGLAPSDVATETNLVRQYERHMLLRAQAAVLLKQRGHDTAVLELKA